MLRHQVEEMWRAGETPELSGRLKQREPAHYGPWSPAQRILFEPKSHGVSLKMAELGDGKAQLHF